LAEVHHVEQVLAGAHHAAVEDLAEVHHVEQVLAGAHHAVPLEPARGCLKPAVLTVRGRLGSLANRNRSDLGKGSVGRPRVREWDRHSRHNRAGDVRSPSVTPCRPVLESSPEACLCNLSIAATRSPANQLRTFRADQAMSKGQGRTRSVRRP
jgi:hypothetical protein